MESWGPRAPEPMRFQRRWAPEPLRPQSLCAPGPLRLGPLALKGPRALEPLGPRPQGPYTRPVPSLQYPNAQHGTAPACIAQRSAHTGALHCYYMSRITITLHLHVHKTLDTQHISRILLQEDTRIRHRYSIAHCIDLRIRNSQATNATPPYPGAVMR